MLQPPKRSEPQGECLEKNLPCDLCGSSDGVALYSDPLRRYCFSCRKVTFLEDGDQPKRERTPVSKNIEDVLALIEKGTVKAIPSRKITQETCRKFDYRMKRGSAGGVDHIAVYRDSNREPLWAKVRHTGTPEDPKKEFAIVGKADDSFFGAHLWSAGQRGKLTIVGGEIDCLSVAQATDLQWPVVAPGKGEQSLARCIKANLPWVLAFDVVCIGMDMDKAGQDAAQEALALLPPGKARLINWTQKDPNAMLLAGEGKQIFSCIWNAQEYRPDGIIDARDLTERCLAPPIAGLPWPWAYKTQWTFGRRFAETYLTGAGCVDYDTEYLSPAGWRAIGQYPGGLVAQYAPDGKLEFVEPLAFVDLPCAQASRVVTKYGIDMVLTPEHTVVYFSENTGRLHTASWGAVQDQHDTSITGFRGRIRSGYDFHPGHLWDPNELRLQVAVEADGHTHQHRCHIRVKRPRKKARLEALFTATGREPTRWIQGEYTTYSFEPPMRKGALYSQPFTDFLGGDLKVIAEEAPQWDGDQRKTFRTTVKQSADMVQFAMCASGMKASIRTYPRPDKGHTEYHVFGTDRQYISMRAASAKPPIVTYPMERKYCFSVPSGMLILRRNDQVFVTGNSGLGKSDYIAEVVAADLQGITKDGETYSPQSWGLFCYESGAATTKKTIAGKIAKRRFHIPDADWTQEQLEATLHKMDHEMWDAGGKLFINDSMGMADWDAVKDRCRWLNKANNVRHFLVDPVGALVTDSDDERKDLDRIALEWAKLMVELDACGYMVSHLTRPSQGPSHEEGGQTSLKQFRGSNGLIMFSSFVFGLERNQQAEDEGERTQTVERSLKDRYTGNSTGKTNRLFYDVLSGTLDTMNMGALDE
jgi:hypothetical protein